MKHFTLVLFLVISVQVFAGSPQVINYQAVARNSSGNPIPNQLIGVRFTIHDVSQSGTIVFQETDTATTNQFGYFTIGIGTGVIVQGSLPGINWSNGSKYLQVELDPAGGTSYTNMGTTQIVSVPYAQNANKSDTSRFSNYSDTSIFAAQTDTAVYAAFAAGSNWSDYANYDEEDLSGSPPLTTFSDSTWVIRQVDNTLSQQGLSISRTGANIMLQPGTYYITASAQWGIDFSYTSGASYTQAAGQLRLRNITSGTTVLSALGQNFWTSQATINASIMRQPYYLSLTGVITVTSTSTFNLQQYVSYTNFTGNISVDAGVPVQTGDNEVYSNIIIRKIQ